ncbi:hypothetical protein PFISCL1PPCAC_2154, partial [Pristionchus fissidentatus]
FQMASSAFFAFIIVPLVLIVLSLYAYRRLYAIVIRQRQKMRRDSCAAFSANATVIGEIIDFTGPLPTRSPPSPLPILSPSSLPYSPQSVFTPTTLSFPSDPLPPPYPLSPPLPSPPITPSISIPSVPAPPYTERMDSVDLRETTEPPPAYEEIAEKIEKRSK